MLRAALDFLMPRTCHICDGKLADHEQFVCTMCLDKLPRTRYHSMPMNGMVQRFAGQFPFRHASGHFFYSRSSDLARLVHNFKYHSYPSLARRLGRLMAEELYITPFLNDIDVIIPVPMHWLKKARRGYNQAEMLALGIAEVTGAAVVTDLRAVRGHRTQTKMTLQQRLLNTEGLFRVDDPSRIDGHGVLLVDDVCTTGSTLANASRALWRDSAPSSLTLLTLGVTT